MDNVKGSAGYSDPDRTATTSEIAREDLQKEIFGTAEYKNLKEQDKVNKFEYGLQQARVEDELRKRKAITITSDSDSSSLSPPPNHYELRRKHISKM